MNTLLVAVKSSFVDLQAGKHDALRSAWGYNLHGKAHLKFFLGRETGELGGVQRSVAPSLENCYIAKSDEVIVEAPDGPTGDVRKVRQICGFIGSKNITHVLIVDVNSTLDVNAALAVPFGAFDYAGTFDNWGDVGPRAFVNAKGEVEAIERCYDFAKGENGVFLSRRATLEIADTPPRPALYVTGNNWDLWIGQVIGPLVGQESFLTMSIDPVAVKA